MRPREKCFKNVLEITVFEFVVFSLWNLVRSRRIILICLLERISVSINTWMTLIAAPRLAPAHGNHFSCGENPPSPQFNKHFRLLTPFSYSAKEKLM